MRADKLNNTETHMKNIPFQMMSLIEELPFHGVIESNSSWIPAIRKISSFMRGVIDSRADTAEALFISGLKSYLNQVEEDYASVGHKLASYEAYPVGKGILYFTRSGNPLYIEKNGRFGRIRVGWTSETSLHGMLLLATGAAIVGAVVPHYENHPPRKLTPEECCAEWRSAARFCSSEEELNAIYIEEIHKFLKWKKQESTREIIQISREIAEINSLFEREEIDVMEMEKVAGMRPRRVSGVRRGGSKPAE